MGSSLEKYKDNTPTINVKAHIDNTSIERTRNREAVSTPYYGKHGSLSNVWTSSPSIDWNKYSTNDRITDFNNSGSDKAAKALKGLAIVGSIFTLGATAASVIGTIKQNKENNTENAGFSRKERKEINRNTQDTEKINEALDSSIETANSIDENASESTVRKAAENLMENITTAQKQKNQAINDAETASKNIKTLNTNLTEKKAEKDGYTASIADLTLQLQELEKIDQSQLTETQKDTIKKLKKDIKELEKKVEECEKSIKDYEEKIAVQTEIMNQNNATAKALDAKIKQANPLVEKLNNKLNEKEK